MSVTAYEIARIIGVSPATVSIVLNNKSGVGEETRLNILELAKNLGYKKPKGHSSTSLKSINLVIYKKHGDVVSDTPFFSELIQGLEQQTRKSGYSLLVFYFYESHDAVEQIRAITLSSCKGIILLATEMTAQDMRYFANLPIPIVLLDNSFTELNIDSITINNIQGSSEAVRYLLRMGHKTIGHLRSRVEINNFYERREGFLKGLGTESKNILTLPVSSTSEGAYEDMKAHLEKKPQIPGAFFADNDIIAISCIRALREAGYQIPEQVSIIGFDDIPSSAVIDPPLSTMRVPKTSMGMMAVEWLIRRIEKEITETIRIEVNTELIIRSSVKSLI